MAAVAVVAVAAGVGVVHAQLVTGSRLGYGDLVIYRAAAAGWLHGDPVYAMGFGAGRLPFTYPPFALAVFGWLPLLGSRTAGIVVLLLNIAAVAVISTVTVHAAVPRFPPPDAGRLTVAVGSRWGRVLLTAAAAGVSLLAEPVRHTLGFGQVNLLLCAVIVVDCLLVPAGRRGYLVGAATAVKLTPAVFLLLFMVSAGPRPGS